VVVLVEHALVVEWSWELVEKIQVFYEADLLTDPKWAELRIGIRLHFHVTTRQPGIKRFSL
jgi:hypothetical protein